MRRTTVMAAALAIALTSLAFADDDDDFDHHGRGMGMGMHSPRMQMKMPGMHRMGPGMAGPHLLALAEELDLTKDQIDRLEGLHEGFQEQQIDRRADLRKAELRLRRLTRDEDAVEADVMRAIDETARIKAEIHKARYGLHRQAQSILTDKQKAKLEELRAERRGRFEFRFDDDEDDDADDEAPEPRQTPRGRYPWRGGNR